MLTAPRTAGHPPGAPDRRHQAIKAQARLRRSNAGLVRRHSPKTAKQVAPPRPRQDPSLKGGDPAAGSPTATLLRLHPSR